MTFKYVHIWCISGIYLCISRLYLFICLYSALLGGLRPPDLNKIYTDINDMNRYEQICLCSYQLIFLQFMQADGSAKMHLAFICRRYLCTSVNICLYLGISVFIISAYIRAYACVCVQGAYGPHWSLCRLGSRPCGLRC